MKTPDKRMSIKLSQELGTRLTKILSERTKTEPMISLQGLVDEIIKPAIEVEERRLGIRG